MTTVPGFSSRTTDTTFRQFPARDEALMTDIAGMETPGWSNSQTVAPDVAAVDSNAAVITEADSKVVEPEAVEDKAVKKTTSARKSARKKG